MIQHTYLELHYSLVETTQMTRIQVSLDSKYDAKHKLGKNRRGSTTTVMIWHSYLELHYFSVEKTQTTVTPRVSSHMVQYRYH